MDRFIESMVRRFNRREGTAGTSGHTGGIRKPRLTVPAVWGLYTAWGVAWGVAHLIATLQRLAPQIHDLLLRLGLQ